MAPRSSRRTSLSNQLALEARQDPFRRRWGRCGVCRRRSEGSEMYGGPGNSARLRRRCSRGGAMPPADSGSQSPRWPNAKSSERTLGRLMRQSHPARLEPARTVCLRDRSRGRPEQLPRAHAELHRVQALRAVSPTVRKESSALQKETRRPRIISRTAENSVFNRFRWSAALSVRPQRRAISARNTSAFAMLDSEPRSSARS